MQSRVLPQFDKDVVLALLVATHDKEPRNSYTQRRVKKALAKDYPDLTQSQALNRGRQILWSKDNPTLEEVRQGLRKINKRKAELDKTRNKQGARVVSHN